MSSTNEDRVDRRGGVIAFQADAELLASADALAVQEGISRSDVARRALKRELNRSANEVI